MRTVCAFIIFWLQMGGMMGRISAVQSQIARSLHDPLVRAMLDTIAYAEGTDLISYKTGSCKQYGYDMLFGGGTFEEFDDHPRRFVCIRRKDKTIATTAAGRYQIQVGTWDHYMQTRRIHNQWGGDIRFTPVNQDRVAIQIMIDKNVLDPLLAGTEPLEELFRRLGGTFASMPGAKWGFVVYTPKQLENVFNTRLATYRKVRQYEGNLI